MTNDQMLYGEVTIEVGVWHERAARKIDRCPSYYAADHETLETKPGDYPVRIVFVGGYTVPMPQWMLIGIPSTRLDGRLYSGCGGVNYSSTELPKGEAVDYVSQWYAYSLKDCVARGDITLKPGFECLLAQKPWEAGNLRCWGDVRALGAAA